MKPINPKLKSSVKRGSNSCVFRNGQAIYIFGDIDEYSMADAITMLNKTIHDINIHAKFPENEIIDLYISSPGGFVYYAVPFINAICNSPIIVRSIVSGIAASAASLIACSCHIRVMDENSQIMLHNPFAPFNGNVVELRTFQSSLESTTKMMIDIYKKNSNLTEKKIRELLNAET